MNIEELIKKYGKAGGTASPKEEEKDEDGKLSFFFFRLFFNLFKTIYFLIQ